MGAPIGRLERSVWMAIRHQLADALDSQQPLPPVEDLVLLWIRRHWRKRYPDVTVDTIRRIAGPLYDDVLAVLTAQRERMKQAFPAVLVDPVLEARFVRPQGSPGRRRKER